MIAAIRVIAEHLVAEIGKTALDGCVLRAMAKVPRHEFVPLEVQPYAYLNRPLPIGLDKTISQPFNGCGDDGHAQLKPDDAVLEIGTGLGYQSAVLAELAGSVYTLEIIDELAQRAMQRLKREGRFGLLGGSRVLIAFLPQWLNRHHVLPACSVLYGTVAARCKARRDHKSTRLRMAQSPDAQTTRLPDASLSRPWIFTRPSHHGERAFYFCTCVMARRGPLMRPPLRSQLIANQKNDGHRTS